MPSTKEIKGNESREIDVAMLRVGNKPSNVSKTIKIPDNLGIMDSPSQKAPEGFGCFRIMTPQDGDKRVVWDSRDFAQITEAKSMFDELVIQGLVPYCVGVNGRASSEVMVEFDPYAEEIIFLPVAMVVGG
jgi:hypothetical protein